MVYYAHYWRTWFINGRVLIDLMKCLSQVYIGVDNYFKFLHVGVDGWIL